MLDRVAVRPVGRDGLEPADAALFNYVHDITRTPDAVRNILSQLKPGARIAIAGMKFFPWWTGPLNLLAWAKNRPYNEMVYEMLSATGKPASCSRPCTRVASSGAPGAGYTTE